MKTNQRFHRYTISTSTKQAHAKEPQVQKTFHYPTDKKNIIRNRLSSYITPIPTQCQYSSFALAHHNETHHNETVNSTWTLIWITVGKSEGVGSIWWKTRVVSRSEGRTIGMYITAIEDDDGSNSSDIPKTCLQWSLFHRTNPPLDVLFHTDWITAKIKCRENW